MVRRARVCEGVCGCEIRGLSDRSHCLNGVYKQAAVNSSHLMASTVAASVACCFCCGVAEYVRRQVKADYSAEQRYKALSTTADDDDDDDDEYDMNEAASAPSAANSDTDAELLDFATPAMHTPMPVQAQSDAVMSASRCVGPYVE